MNNDSLIHLIERIAEFPGIGERQAYRIAQHILRRDTHYIQTLIHAIEKARETIHQCPQCRIYHEETSDMCRVCNDTKRDESTIVVVEKDIDIEAIEKAGIYDGRYFIFGALIPIKSPEYIQKSTLHTLLERIKKEHIHSVILAFSVHPDAEHTTHLIADALKTMKEKEGLSFAVRIPGRGFSSGLELEYADPETIRHAFTNTQET